MQSLDKPLFSVKMRVNAEAAPWSLKTVDGLRPENRSISADVLGVQAGESW